MNINQKDNVTLQDMHIAYITAEYPHSTLKPTGGIGVFISHMAHALVAQNVKVTIFLCLADEDKEWEDDKIRIVQIKRVKSKWNPIKNWINIAKRINRYLEESDISLIESADWEGLHAFINTTIPVITRINGSVSYFNKLENKKQSPIMKFIEKKALLKSNAIISASKFAADETKAIFKIDTDIEVIYNLVQYPGSLVSNKDVSSKMQILYFGTLVRKKGVLEIPHIFNLVVEHFLDVDLILAGKDSIDSIESRSTWEIMESMFSEKAKTRLSYIGTLDYSSMQQCIKDATICIFPSYAEAFPLSWLEAMSHQKPLVASSVGWATEMIDNGRDGILVYPSNHEEYAAEIIRLLEAKELRESIGINAVEKIKNKFNWDTLVQENICFYKRNILK